MRTATLFANTSRLIRLRGQVFADAGQSEQVLAQARQRLEAIATETQQILDAAGDNMTDEQLAKLKQLEDESTKLERKIQGLEISARIGTASAGRRATPEPVKPQKPGQPAPSPEIHTPATVSDPTMGFGSFGEFAQCVQHGSIPGNERDRRLIFGAATTFGNEGTGADGGFLIPPVFRTSIWQKVLEQENLLSRCTPLTTSGNSLTVPKDETTPWDTSSGIQVYWESEGSAASQSKPAFETTTYRLNKLMGLVPITEELQADAPGLESWLMTKAPAKMAARINTAIVRGNGVGKPLGILNAPCTISVAKETSQPADTIYYGNIVKMWARMWAPSRRNAIWLINQDIEPQLDSMAFDPAATAGKVPVYLPQNSISASPYAALKGRPVVPIEACSTLGDQGDIILADMTQYWAITKGGGGIQTDVSIHLWFDQAITAFRFIFRITGSPVWGGAISPENGTATRSCFVTLDARA